MTKEEKELRKVKKELKTKDFSVMDKQTVNNLLEMFPKMDKELALKVMDQFPEYKETMLSMINEMSSIANKMIDSNDTETTQTIENCNKIIASLAKQLENENLTFEQRNTLNNQMLEVNKRIFEMNKDNKAYRKEMLKDFMCVISGLALTCMLFVGRAWVGDSVPIPSKS